MRKLWKFFVFFLISVMIMILPTLTIFSNKTMYAVLGDNKKEPVKIAVFFDNSEAMYISLLHEDLEKIQKENADKVEFTFFDAGDNQTIQNQNIEGALNQNFDLFIIGVITPNLNDIKSTLTKVMNKNIPFILNPDPAQDIIDFVRPYKKFVVIGADFEQSGTMEGEILAREWYANKKLIDKNHDNILQYVMLKGRIGSPLTSLRTKYSVLALNDAGIKTEELASPYCQWIEDCSTSAIESLYLKYGNKIEAIISNNDAMAIGAVKALQKYGYNTDGIRTLIPVVGIDGMPVAKDLIQKGFMTGTIIVDPHDLAELLYSVGMNLAYGKSTLENTNYKFDYTGYTIHLSYTQYIK